MNEKRERNWVLTVRDQLRAALGRNDLFVEAGTKLAYATTVLDYPGDAEPNLAAPNSELRNYETDLVILEKIRGEKRWAPRVIIEFKFADTNSHDALTYSAKAAAHRAMHPALRYGFVIGDMQKIPRRIMYHGEEFDFIMVIDNASLVGSDFETFVSLIQSEIEASRTLEEIFVTRHSKTWLLHRKLVTKKRD